jgi:hypothetical protein
MKFFIAQPSVATGFYKYDQITRSMVLPNPSLTVSWNMKTWRMLLPTLTVYWIAHYQGDPDTTLFVGMSGVRTDAGIRADITAENGGNPNSVQVIANYGAATPIETVDGNNYIPAPPV